MLKTIRVRVVEGALRPVERLELEEGSEIMITLDVEVGGLDDVGSDRFRSAIGAWKGTHDPEELLRNIYSDRLTGSKRDFRI